ncbi:hypothetical protein HDV05_007038, partial [Chytridiales sp. JEL 0842]
MTINDTPGQQQHQRQQRRQQTIAIVGSGITGLTCAYILSTLPQQQGLDPIHVTVFETEPLVGMDAHSVNVPVKKETIQGEDPAGTRIGGASDTNGSVVSASPASTVNGDYVRLGTPPRAFSPSYYPHLWELYKHANIPVEAFDWSMSVSLFENPEPALYHSNMLIRLFGDTHIPASVSTVFRWATNPVVRSIVVDSTRFLTDIARDFPKDPSTPDFIGTKQKPHKESIETLREYIDRGGYSETYITHALLPMLSMVCTCSYEACLNYPVHVVAHYFNRSVTRNQYRTANGTLDAATRLLKSAKTIRLGCKVLRVSRAGATAKSSAVSGGGGVDVLERPT